MANVVVIAQFGLKQREGVQPVSGVTVESVRVQEEANMAASWSFVLSIAKFQTFDGHFKLLLQEATPRIYVRLGRQDAGAVVWDPWQEHVVVQLKAIPRISAYTASLRTADRLAETNRETRTAAWQGPISQMAERLATTMGLAPVVESTTGDYRLIQSFCSNFEFMQRLLARAVNSAGRADYRFFVRDGQLHFHTAGYAAASPALVRGFFAPTTRTTLEDHTQLMVHVGAAGARLNTFNPFDGQVELVNSGKPHKLARLSPALEQIPGGAVNQGLTFGVNPTEAKDRAQAIFEQARLRNYRVKLRLEGRLLHVDELLDLDLTQAGTPTSSWSGRYIVESAVHLVRQGTLTSSIIATRGDVN